MEMKLLYYAQEHYGNRCRILKHTPVIYALAGTLHKHTHGVICVMSIFRCRQRRFSRAEPGLATYRPRGPKGGTACSSRGRISGGTDNR